MITEANILDADLSLTTLQQLDAAAVVTRLEAHEQYMEYLFTKDSGDFAAKVQTIIHEIQFVKTNIGGDTLRWRLYSALNLMFHISRGLQKILSRMPEKVGLELNSSTVAYDDYLKSTLKSADVQLLSTLNEVRQRDMDDYFLAFRERFAPEYDLIHNEYAVDFYEKTKALMVYMSFQRRALAVHHPRADDVVSKETRHEENEVNELTWI